LASTLFFLSKAVGWAKRKLAPSFLKQKWWARASALCPPYEADT
jgi:hypothetical protein